VGVVGWGLVIAIGALVVVPLAREYLDLRRTRGLSPLGGLVVTALVVPAFGVGFALALPLGDRPGLQWAVTVVTTLTVYSLAVRAIEVLRPSPAAPAPGRLR
jgi:hypothetical protein